MRRIRHALYPRAALMLVFLAFVFAVLLLSPRSDGASIAEEESISVAKEFQESVSASFSSDGQLSLEAASTSGVLDAYRQSLPSDVAEEVWTAPGSEVLVANDGCVVGYAMAQNQAEASKEVRSGMEDLGWTYVESGTEALATYVKDEGAFRWASVGITEVGGSSSVVISLKRSDG